MPSYVEQAILRVVDQSTGPIRKINAELVKLFRTARAGRNINIRLNGIDKATQQIRDLNKVVARIPTNKRIGVSLGTGSQSLRATVAEIERQLKRLEGKSVQVRVSMPGLSQSLRQMRDLNAEIARSNQRSVRPSVRYDGAGSAYQGNRLPSLTTAPFPGNIPAAFNLSAAYLTVNATRVIINGAIEATFDAQREDTARELIFQNNPELKAEVQSAAREIFENVRNISSTRAEKIARDAAVTGFRGENLDRFSMALAEMEVAAKAIMPAGRAESLVALATKTGNLASVTEDPERAEMMVSAMMKSAILAGETFNASTAIGALRTSGFAQTLNEEGMIRFMMAVDEMGRQAGSGLQRLNQIMTTPEGQAGAGGGVAKGVVEALVKAGLRTDIGLEAETTAFAQDPMGFLAEALGQALRATDETLADSVDRGDNLTIEQRGELRQTLTEMGFNTNALRMVLSELSSLPEREKGLDLVAGMTWQDMSQFADPDLGFQIDNLTQQLKSLSAEALTPLFSIIAPGVKIVSDWLNELARSESQLERFGAVGVTAAAAIAALAGAVGIARRAFSVMGFGQMNAAAAAHQSAAQQLMRAAMMLQGRGAAPDAAPDRASRRGGRAAAAAAAGGSARGSALGLLGKVARVGGPIAAVTAAIAPTQMGDGTLPEEVWREEARRQGKQLGAWADTAARSALAEMAERAQAGPNMAERDYPFAAAYSRPGTMVTGGIPGAGNMSEAEIADLRSVMAGEGIAEGSRLMQDAFTMGGDAMRQTFATGTDQLATVGPVIDTAAASFGPAAGQGLLAMAPSVGEAMARAFSAAVGAIKVNATVQDRAEPRLDTGLAMPQ